jgi:hypothetical protein
MRTLVAHTTVRISFPKRDGAAQQNKKVSRDPVRRPASATLAVPIIYGQVAYSLCKRELDPGH